MAGWDCHRRARRLDHPRRDQINRAGHVTARAVHDRCLYYWRFDRDRLECRKPPRRDHLNFHGRVPTIRSRRGSAAIAHSAVATDKPVSEGFVGLLEPFIDTVVICTLTGLVIITTFPPETFMAGDVQGIELTSAAFEEKISWSPIPLSIAAILFAFSTMLAWAYYGTKAWTYVFGEGRKKEILFSTIFCVFIVIGAAVKLEAILDFADALIFIMAIPNLVGLYILAPEVKRDLKDYFEQISRPEPATDGERV